MVSKFDHALLHLLYQIRVGWLDATVAAIVSNHPDAKPIAEQAGVPFYLLPVDKTNKAAQEAKLQELVLSTEADLVVLARYMQVLSDSFSRRLFGRVINIHHSFLPSFKGAKPYHQAHERGVKIIGATAHYVTPELDEGPIIEQETARVNHAMSAEDLLAVGPGHREPRAGAGGEAPPREPGDAERQEDGGVRLDRDHAPRSLPTGGRSSSSPRSAACSGAARCRR